MLRTSKDPPQNMKHKPNHEANIRGKGKHTLVFECLQYCHGHNIIDFRQVQSKSLHFSTLYSLLR